jgi:hypothetical protein
MPRFGFSAAARKRRERRNKNIREVPMATKQASTATKNRSASVSARVEDHLRRIALSDEKESIVLNEDDREDWK